MLVSPFDAVRLHAARLCTARGWAKVRLDRCIRPVVGIAISLLLATSAYGYSVLTHEAIVDSLWDAAIQKMLLARFPMATPEELEQAHAYVYGG